MAESTLRLLIQTSGRAALRMDGSQVDLGGVPFRVERLFKHRPAAETFGLVRPEWLLAVSESHETHAWDAAHEAVMTGLSLGLAPGFSYAEPDLLQEWPWPYGGEAALALAAAPPCQFERADPFWPAEPSFAWFLDSAHSGLGGARGAVDHTSVRIAHLDTGYAEHVSKPRNLRTDLGWNLVDDNDDTRDPGMEGFLNNPGHGAGTLGILAGNTLTGLVQPHQNTGEPLGGAPDAQIVPVRIASSVVHFYSSAMAQGIDYAIAPRGDPSQGCDVVSISMGGLASRAWADAVNRAYEAGVCIVAAAGNNVTGGTLLRTIVYPARFRRVIAACGITADGTPYHRLGAVGRMQGNFGPASKMATAMAAYTPNTPWAHRACANLIQEGGGGTSSATPQVAAAAALWLAKHHPSYDLPWKRVEAVRQALFSTAAVDPARAEYFGNGAIRASAALQVSPSEALQMTPADSVFLPILGVLTGMGLAPAQADMVHVEAAQLLQTSETLSRILDDPDLPVTDEAQVKRFLEALVAEPGCSNTLRRYVEGEYRQRFRSFPAAAATADPVVLAPEEQQVPVPEVRRLRGYAFDPALSSTLATAALNQMTFTVRWEKDLEPGPVGEYLEVIDFDGRTGRRQPAVNLDHPHLLARDGLDPSEGSSQFHQQMVYAVAMKTIEYFERALGRSVFWAPKSQSSTGPTGEDSVYVPRLRIHPHAMEQRNAYYSPAQKALLFGYFRAADNDPGRQYPGGMVFTCLSHDIIAHETTHAILDGMHRRFSLPTNPDMLAFHEAFADVVALFQHFAFPEVVRDQIARTRSDLTAASLLANLAHQFGVATGMRGALRSAVGLEPDPAAYRTTMEPHRRGSILVATIFDAFVAIYNRRAADLLRIATEGSGVLRPGHLGADLVNRLAEEASRSAQHILDICIRALDYCPPVDLTFGDYLRALVTADYELIPNDAAGYRLAFLDAFRRRGVYPLDVATLSVESLRWQPPDWPRASDAVSVVLNDLRSYAEQSAYVDSRRALFDLTERTRRRLREAIVGMIQAAPDRAEIASMLGLDVVGGDSQVEVHALRLAHKIRQNRTAQAQAIVELTQTRTLPLDEANPSRGTFAFHNGSTLVIDLREVRLQYAIVKNAEAPNRLQRTREYLRGATGPGMALYADQEPFAFLHASESNEELGGSTSRPHPRE